MGVVCGAFRDGGVAPTKKSGHAPCLETIAHGVGPYEGKAIAHGVGPYEGKAIACGGVAYTARSSSRTTCRIRWVNESASRLLRNVSLIKV